MVLAQEDESRATEREYGAGLVDGRPPPELLGCHEARAAVLAVRVEQVGARPVHVEVHERDLSALEVIDHTAVVEVDRHEAGTRRGHVGVEDLVERGEDPVDRQIAEPPVGRALFLAVHPGSEGVVEDLTVDPRINRSQSAAFDGHEALHRDDRRVLNGGVKSLGRTQPHPPFGMGREFDEPPGGADPDAPGSVARVVTWDLFEDLSETFEVPGHIGFEAVHSQVGGLRAHQCKLKHQENLRPSSRSWSKRHR